MADQRTRPPRVGVVLSAGGARGWAHIGALKALIDRGVPIDMVCGASSGALVAASHAAGRLDALEELARGLTYSGMLRFFDISFSGGGLIEGRWIIDFVRDHIGDIQIEETETRFGAVATEYRSGREVWFTSGSLVDAVRASIALPGILTPVLLNGRWLYDGALVNPLPVALCRSLGADIIIGIDTGGDPHRPGPSIVEGATEESRSSAWLDWMAGGLPEGWRPWAEHAALGEPDPRRPGSLEVVSEAIFTMQTFLTRVRLAADPPDLVIAPKLDGIGIMEFHRGAEAIARGEEAVAEEDDLLGVVEAAVRGRRDARVRNPD